MLTLTHCPHYFSPTVIFLLVHPYLPSEPHTPSPSSPPFILLLLVDSLQRTSSSRSSIVLLLHKTAPCLSVSQCLSSSPHLHSHFKRQFNSLPPSISPTLSKSPCGSLSPIPPALLLSLPLSPPSRVPVPIRIPPTPTQGRETDIQIDSPRDRHTDRHRDRDREPDIQPETKRQRDREKSVRE